MPVPNSSSPEIQRNDQYNPIPDNSGQDRIAESETAESILNYWQEHNEVDSDGENEFSQRHSEIFPIPAWATATFCSRTERQLDIFV